MAEKGDQTVLRLLRITRNCAGFSMTLSLLGASALAAPIRKDPAPAKAEPPSSKAASTPVKVPSKPAVEVAKTAATGAKPGAEAATPAPATPAPAKPKPKQVPRVAPPPPAPVAPASATDAEVTALRVEVQALREDLKRAVGTPTAAPDPERDALQAELAEEQKKLEAIRAAVASGLDPSAVSESMSHAETRVAELEAALAKLPVKEERPAPSLYDVSVAVERLDAAAARDKLPAATTVSALAPPETKPLVPVEPPADASESMQKMGLLPLEFTAFGDFFYRFERPGADDFHVGAMELDASLDLSPYVKVSTAIPYSGDEQAFSVAAFVIDCGVAGEGDDFIVKNKAIEKSGVTFGKFDVPFGIAYLQYPATENRLITQPQAVELTHGAWNDMGAQGYAVGKHWTAVGYVVNGQPHPINAEETALSRTAVGGRLSAKDDVVELGGSAALHMAAEGPVMLFAGGDVTTQLGPLDIRGEYLLKQVQAEGLPELTHGVYGQTMLQLDPAFLMGRYDTVYAGPDVLERRFAGGAGVEIFPSGELRAVYEQSLDSDLRTVTLQIVGGSSFQPTGLRR